MVRLLNKGVKTITIHVVASKSPLVASKFVTSKVSASKFEIESNIRSKRRLDLNQNNSSGSGNFQVLLNDFCKIIVNHSVSSCTCANNNLMLVDSILCLKKYETLCCLLVLCCFYLLVSTIRLEIQPRTNH